MTDSLHDLSTEVGRALKACGLKVAVAESCTGGYIVNLLTDIAGASEYVDRAVVCYSNAAKESLLGVTPTTLKVCGAVSRETATEMAEGLRQASGVDLALATTGIAGPRGGTPQKPVGTVFVAMAYEGGVDVQEHHFPVGRLDFKKRVAKAALEMLKGHLSR